MWLSLASLIVGIAATIIVSRYYYKRALGKSLTPFLQFSSSPLQGVDPRVRANLEIQYEGKQIKNLYEVQFLIANTGDKSIRDAIEPLSLFIPTACKLLDATVLHVSPEGRKVALQAAQNGQRIEFDVPLLNRNEFFIVKLLLDGIPKMKEFIFSIVVDELPPKLQIEPLPPEAIATPDVKKFSPLVLLVGLVCLSLGVSVADLVYKGFQTFPPLREWFHGANLFFMGWYSIAVGLSVFPSLIFIIIGVIGALSCFSDGNFPPPRRRFVVPKEKKFLMRHRLFLRPPPGSDFSYDETSEQ